MTSIPWRLGIEIELLAPPGKSRWDLAQAIAQAHHGSVRRFFHPQSEPSKVPGTPLFHNLTLGFEVLDAENNWIARCVDDLTLQADLVPQAPPKPGWYRIISDDERLLRLIQRQTNPEQPLEEVLQPIANLFGTVPRPGPNGMVGIHDETGASIAIVAPLPGERERPCELITPPLDRDHQARLDEFLGIARSLGFTAPVEGAIHLHFDATALQSARAIAAVVQRLSAYGPSLKQLLGTNPHCHRLGQWPSALLTTVSHPDFSQLSWPEAQHQLLQLPLTKYCDFNLVNCLRGFPDKNTIEIRILPVWLESGPILEAAALFVALLNDALSEPTATQWSVQEKPREGITTLLENLPLSSDQREYWQQIGTRKLASAAQSPPTPRKN